MARHTRKPAVVAWAEFAVAWADFADVLGDAWDGSVGKWLRLPWSLRDAAAERRESAQRTITEWEEWVESANTCGARADVGYDRPGAHFVDCEGHPGHDGPHHGRDVRWGDSVTIWWRDSGPVLEHGGQS